MIEKVINIFEEFKLNMKRFPVTVIICFFIGVISIYLNNGNTLIVNELEPTKIAKILEDIKRMLILSAPLSLSIGLLNERMDWEKLKKHSLYIVLIVFIFVYYMFFGQTQNIIAEKRWMGMLLIGIIFVLLMGYKKNNYERYVLEIIKSFFITFLYSMVLYLGIIGIITAVFGLFNISSSGHYYYNTYIIIGTIFAPSFFISKIPDKEVDFTNEKVSKVWESLFSYIIIPILCIYLVILYLYFIKVLVIREIPRNLISHLVIWSSLVSIAILFMTRPFREKNIISSLYRKIYPIINIPLLIMLFFASYKRINQYGWTENRYLIVLVGIWIMLINLYFIIKKEDNRRILISFIILLIIYLFSPINAFKISFKSQNNRFTTIFKDNNLIQENKLVKKEYLDERIKIEINNLLVYFDRNHDIQEVSFIPKDFKLNETEKYFGFEYQGYIMDIGKNKDWIFYNLGDENLSLDIKKYDFLYQTRGYEDKEGKIGPWDIKIIGENKGKLEFTQKNRYIEINIEELLKEDIDNLNETDFKNEKYIFEENYDGLDIKLIITEFYMSSLGKDLILEDVNYILLIK